MCTTFYKSRMNFTVRQYKKNTIFLHNRTHLSNYNGKGFFCLLVYQDCRFWKWYNKKQNLESYKTVHHLLILFFFFFCSFLWKMLSQEYGINFSKSNSFRSESGFTWGSRFKKLDLHQPWCAHNMPLEAPNKTMVNKNTLLEKNTDITLCHNSYSTHIHMKKSIN